VNQGPRGYYLMKKTEGRISRDTVPLIPVNFNVLISLNKTGSNLDRPCSSPDSNLESGEEQYVYRTLNVSILESGAPIIRRIIGIWGAIGCPNLTF
jgi:hypothetical protein